MKSKQSQVDRLTTEQLAEIRDQHDNETRYRNGKPASMQPHAALCYADTHRQQLLDHITALEAKLEAAERKTENDKTFIEVQAKTLKRVGKNADKAEATITALEADKQYSQSLKVKLYRREQTITAMEADTLNLIKANDEMSAQAQLHIAALEAKLRMFVWSESNPSEYVNELDKALATITALEAERVEFEDCAKHDIRSYMDINKGLLNDMPCPACGLREQEQES